MNPSIILHKIQSEHVLIIDNYKICFISSFFRSSWGLRFLCNIKTSSVFTESVFLILQGVPETCATAHIYLGQNNTGHTPTGKPKFLHRNLIRVWQRVLVKAEFLSFYMTPSTTNKLIARLCLKIKICHLEPIYLHLNIYVSISSKTMHLTIVDLPSYMPVYKLAVFSLLQEVHHKDGILYKELPGNHFKSITFDFVQH